MDTPYRFTVVGCPIRIPADHLVCANPRGFSQLITSFFASESLGIPRVPLFTYLSLPTRQGARDKKPLKVVLASFLFLLTRYPTSKNICLPVEDTVLIRSRLLISIYYLLS